MSMWIGLGQAATIAQMSGLDAFGLTAMIMQAVHMVRRNKKACKQLSQRVQMIADLLQTMQSSEMMQRPETRTPLDGLEETLRRAYILITSCQNSSSLYLFFTGESLANKFSEVQNSIDFYLQLFPVLSHIDTTRLLVRILNGVHPPQRQAAPKLLRSFTSQSNPDTRTEICRSLERFQVLTEPSKVWGCEVTGFTKFSFSQLVDATNNFSPENKIGLGGTSTVYKGLLCHGHVVAIKRRFKLPTELDFQYSDFDHEIQNITKLQHTNIVKLLGCCFHGTEKVLVYEYLLNGSLESFIFDTRTGESKDWPVRSKIIEGIAQGIVYLHKQCGLHIIHRDLKPSNILLDSDMNPKISDFGLSQILNPGADEAFESKVFGTPGFIAPEYREEGLFSVKSDVYSFGALLLQIISGKRLCPLSSRPRDYGPLNTWVWDLWTDESLIHFIDPSLRNEPQIAEIMRCIQIALLCVQENRADRPAMWDVVLMLSCEGVALPVPTRPAYYKRDSSGTGESQCQTADQPKSG